MEGSSTTADIEKFVLKYLNDKGSIANTEDFSAEAKISKDTLEPVLKSLVVDEYITLEVIEKKLIELTDEGKGYAQQGSPEF